MTKNAAARASASFLAERLRPTDELALVVYDDEVDLLAPLGPAGSPQLAAAIPVAETVQAPATSVAAASISRAVRSSSKTPRSTSRRSSTSSSPR